MRLARELGRHKGESLESLEKIELAVGKALAHLREESQDVCMPPRMLEELHRLHTGLGKVFSAQHRARAFRDFIQLVERS